MAADQTGKWVARAASTGGGRTYRGQAPVNWYASLVLIVLLGLGLIAYSRYERTHSTASSAGPPTVGTVWHAALGIDICGKIEPNLPASPTSSTGGFTTDGTGVVTVAPTTASQAGGNAVLGKFVSGVHGLVLTPNSLGYPGQGTHTDGQQCPKGTPDAGKTGVVSVVQWANFTVKKGSSVAGDPRQLRFSDGQMITLAFLPTSVSVPKPPASTITALIKATESSSTTATTVPVTPSTAVTPATTATTAPATKTTTAPKK